MEQSNSENKQDQPKSWRMRGVQFVRRRHPYDGSPQAGEPIGPILTVTKIADHVTADGIIERACVFYLSDGTWEFEWNLKKVYNCKFRREAEAALQKGDS